MNKLYIIENNNRKRVAELQKCINCNEDFLRRKGFNTKFCSNSCSSRHFNNLKGLSKEKLSCAYCQQDVYRTASQLRRSRSGLVFCDKECKRAGQRLKSNIKEVWPNHYGSSKVYRNLVVLDKCVGCGIDLPWLLLVHHIDGNRNNNKFNNLEVVCPVCHVNRHTKLIKGNRVFYTKALTPREDVIALDKLVRGVVTEW